jgi:outer membrane receptor for ferrienterochelin and colicins
MPSVHVSRCRPPRRWGPNPIGRLARLAAHSLVSRVAAPKATIRVALLALGMALTLLPVGRSGVARADGLADEADLHFRLGFECFKNDDVNCALEHWLVSNRLVPNRNVVYNIARAFARSGRFADAHRYYVDALEGESDAKTVADIKAALASIAPKVGVLSVTTDPPGAVIYIGRKDLGSRGRTPRPLALEPGSYKVLVELEGYEPASSAELQLAMGEDKPVSLKLNRILGTVQVGVEGAKHATVHVGDERAASSCEAPCTFDLPPGTYLLYFAAEGYQSVPRQVVVAARQTAKTVARLKPQSGSIIVEADEKGAVVEVDERPMGFTPTVVQNVGVGTRKVRVKLRGYRTVERSVEVKPNQQAELLDLRLEPLRQVSAVSRAIEDIDDAPSSLSIIDGQELRAFGYPTVAEALRGTRGVYLSNDYSYFSAGIRGLGEPNDYGNRLLVLADGHPTNDNVLNSSYIGTDARLDLYDVERIEVVRGPGSLLYGTGAFSGVVNLVTRPRDEPTSVNGAFGTWGNSVAHGRAGGHVNFAEDAGMWASVSGSYSDGVDVPLSLIEPGSGPPVVTVSGADAHRAINTAGHIWWGPVEGQWMYHKRIQFVPVGALSTRINDLRTSYTDERAFGEVRYEPKISDAVQIFTRAHVNHYFFHGFYISPEPDPALLENYYGTWFGGEARVVVTPLDDPRTLRIVVGGEGQYHPVASLYGDELGPNLEELPNGNYLSEERSYALGAAYALLESTPIDWFRLSAGVRVDIYSTFGPIVVPRGALIFKPWEGGVIKLMSGRAFRAPSIYEQYYNDAGFSQAAANDANRGLELGPESTFANELEVSQHFLENWTALASGHASYITGIINTVADTPGSAIIRYANSDSAVLTVGGEAELRREWRQGWMLAGFYGYEHARYLEPSVVPSLQGSPRLANSPRHLAGAKGALPIVQPFASLAARAALEAPRRINLATDDTTGWAVVADLALSGGVPSYGLRYAVGVYNLLDWRYAVPVAETFASRTMVQPGRTFMADLSVAYP